MTTPVRKQRIDTVFVLIVFCVFAVSVLMVLMFGASIYKNMTEISHDGSDERLVLSYIWTKVKNHDNADSIYIDDFYGVTALCFDELIDDTIYRTAIYHYDGWVFELFCEKDLDLYPEDGVRVLSIADLTLVELNNGLINVTTGAKSLLVLPRSTFGEISQREVAPG